MIRLILFILCLGIYALWVSPELFSYDYEGTDELCKILWGVLISASLFSLFLYIRDRRND